MMEYSLEKVIDDIKNEKEIISTLPVNTKKNRAIYVERLKTMKDEYEALRQEILQKIVKEYEKEIAEKSTVDETLEQKQTQINEVGKIENVIDQIKTPYEKMGLDKSIYYLKRFYRKNLETINEEIKKCIDLFKQVGVELKADDFNFTTYIYQYMKKFFKELKKDTFDDKAMKEEFEQIYWKSPDVIVHIRLNLVYLFLVKENAIEEFYNFQEKQVKKRLKISYEEIYERSNYLKRAYSEANKKQGKVIIENFLKGYWNLKDYEEKSLTKSYLKFVTIDKLRANREEVDSNLIKLLHNLYEYDNYLRFKFLYDEVKALYQSEKGKVTYKIIKKKIIKKGNILQMANKLFGMPQKEREKILKEIENLCEELDNIKIKEKICEQLNEKSNLKEMSNVIVSFYKYLFTCIIKYNEDITEEEIKVHIEEFEEFVKYPYNTISESIIMLEDKDIPLMIKDRYNLFDINITKDSLDESNIQNLILDLEKIENYYYIRQAGLELEDIERLCNMNKIISENRE